MLRDLVFVKSDLLERHRLRLGLTRTEFARHCGISGTTRTKLFHGGPVSMRIVRRAAKAAHIDIARLIDDQLLPTSEAGAAVAVGAL